MPELATWQWVLGLCCALVIGVGKTGAPGLGTLTAPLMVLTVGDARVAAAWTAPMLIVGDVFAVICWRRHADARTLLSLLPWAAVGMVLGGAALSLSEPVLRRTLGVLVLTMLALNILKRWRPHLQLGRNPSFYGIATGFSSTIANSAGPVWNLYLLMRRLPKERFVATGAWFFFAVNLAKLPIYSWHQLFSRASLTFDVLMVPAILVGALGGLWVIRRIPQRTFEWLVMVLTAVSAIVLFR